jgi:hypothetical protein
VALGDPQQFTQVTIAHSVNPGEQAAEVRSCSSLQGANNRRQPSVAEFVLGWGTLLQLMW